MPRIAWLTDIHLNFLRPAVLDAFFASLSEADACAVTGDIDEAHDVTAVTTAGATAGSATIAAPRCCSTTSA